MKYVKYEYDNQIRFGILEDGEIVELDQNFINSNSVKTGQKIMLSEVKLLAPVSPSQVIAIGLNYAKHAEERGKTAPKEPMMFMVSQSAIIADNENIELPNEENEIHFEAELAIVIGKEAYKVSREHAHKHIFGYTINNDVSDRVLQKNDGQFTRAKSYKTFKPLGPVIATDIDGNNLEIKLMQNGKVKQHSNTNDLIHNVESIIEKVTDVMTLYPGDIILTGTPSGVGPLKSGDKIEIEIEGIGKLTNNVIF